MPHVVISSGTRTVSKIASDYYTVKGSGVLLVASGGSVKNTYTEASGFVVVESGGQAANTTVCSGATVQVMKGGLTTSDWVSGGRISIYSDGRTSCLTLINGEARLVGGAAYVTDVDNGGSMCLGQVASGYSYAYDTKLKKGAYMEVNSGARAMLTTISSSAEMRVYSGGIVSSTIVSNGGFFYVSGSALNTVISGGTMSLSSGGYASNTKVSGGILYIDKGARTFAATVNGGVVSMTGSSFNGTYSGTTVSIGKGGYSLNEVFRGEYCSLTISGSGTTSGSVESAIIANGAKVYVLDGGRFEGNVNGSAFISMGGGYVDVKSSFNGSFTAKVNGGVFWGAACNISSASVSGGSMNLTNSAIVSSATVSTGRMNLLNGVVVSNAAIEKGAAIGISSGGRMGSGAIRGTLEMALGGSASSMSFLSGGTAKIGGTVDRMGISGGGLKIESGGSVKYADFVSGGYAAVFGSLSSAIVSSGGSLSISGGLVSNAFVSAMGKLNINGGFLSSSYITSGGTLTVNSGGSVGMGDILGSAVIDFGGKATGLAVKTGGRLTVSGSGNLSSCSVLSGTVDVRSGGTLTYGNVSSGGTVTVNGSATAINCTVGKGGVMKVSKGGNSYVLSIQSGGKLTGYYNCSGLSLSSGAIADFNLGMTSAGNSSALVSFLSYLHTNPLFTLTVGASQAKGTYKLATSASGFDSTISVVNTSGTVLGSLTVGQTANIGGVNYRLDLDGDNVLSVTVSAAALAGSAKSDIDGNGISDVMFVWTGNNYAHGYWMNGTNTWQSANSNHPAEWENLGCHDMNANGKADSVLFGNVTSEAGIKGAYIGYYADAIDNPDGSTWVNIGYLTNENNIQWKNTVGNLTGSEAGVNSIVWYAPELYALGVWKDGKEDWATLSGSFGGSDWTLVGCGDFDGDGKDSVVMSYNGGQLFYAVGIDGASTALGSTNWSGWEVRAIGDFSGDQKDDLVLFHKATGSMVMCANGNLDSYVSLAQLDANDWFVVGAGDYNGDQKDDLLVRQYSTGMLGYYSAGDTAQWVELGRGVDMNWTVIA